MIYSTEEKACVIHSSAVHKVSVSGYNGLMPLLIALLLLVPILELALILQVGSWIGFWPTLALLVLDSLLGAVMLRSQGRSSWARLKQALEARRLPHWEAVDGVLVVGGGALLLTPGFLTDIIGMALLVRPVRDLLARAALRRSLEAASASVAGPAGVWGVRSARWGARAMRYDAEGTAEEVPEHQLPSGS